MIDADGDAPAEASELPELEIPAVDLPEEPSDKIFPSVELLDWAGRVPEDETHAPLEQMLKSVPDPAPVELPELQPQGDREGASLLVPHSGLAASTDDFHATSVRVAAALAVAPTEVAMKVDFCVNCHDNRIAKVCLQCHPRERQARMAGGR